MADFDAWLRDLHERMVTPRELVEAAVRRATGTTPVRLERILAGQVCEVYDTGDVIVRISHEEEPRFGGERWALDAARAVGVPTPQVLLLEDAICVEEKLPGERLDVLLDRGEWPAAAIEQIGALLARFHSIRIDGFGYLQPDGRGWPVEFYLLDVLAERVALMAAAEHFGLSAARIDCGLETLAEYAPRHPWTTPRLVHGDFTMDNILIDGDRVSGVIDMEKATGGHPAEDLMIWDSCCGSRIPLKSLLASYGSGVDEAMFHLLLLRRSL